MTAAAGPVETARPQVLATLKALFRDRPLIPLTVLLFILIGVLELVQPGTVQTDLDRFHRPCRDPPRDPRRLPDAGDADGRHRPVRRDGRIHGGVHRRDPGDEPGTRRRHRPRPHRRAIAGVVNGIGVGVFKVHPLIMTLGTGLVVLGLMAAYQQAVLNAGTELPDAIIWLGQGLDIGFLPNSLIVFVPIAAAILLGLRYTGFGRLLFAVGDNPIASRLAGARIWQVLVALYALSAMLAAVAGLLVAGLVNTATSRWSRSPCCHRSRRRSSAGRRSWAAAAAIPGRSSAR